MFHLWHQLQGRQANSFRKTSNQKNIALLQTNQFTKSLSFCSSGYNGAKYYTYIQKKLQRTYYFLKSFLTSVQISKIALKLTNVYNVAVYFLSLSEVGSSFLTLFVKQNSIVCVRIGQLNCNVNSTQNQRVTKNNTLEINTRVLSTKVEKKLVVILQTYSRVL